MIDRTRSSIEEDLSLEEQNFQSVIDMETEDDYTRGNVLLYTNIFARSGTPIDTTLLSAGNYFIEEILITIAYMQLRGTATLAASGVYEFQITDGTNAYFTYYAAEYINPLPGVFPNIVTVSIPINTPMRVGPESMIMRNSSLILHEIALNAFQVIFSLNIYGRIVP